MRSSPSIKSNPVRKQENIAFRKYSIIATGMKNKYQFGWNRAPVY